ncbi:MAG: alpha-hydroxy acid oxidase [Steroidobacteraceae bacterium]
MPWRRRAFRGSDCARTLNINDLREIARRRLPNFIFEYVEGGAEDEATLRRNRSVLEALRFVPRTLVDTRKRRQHIELFGRRCEAPLIIAPTGGNGMISFRGDIALARAAARFGIPFCLSMLSTVSLEQVAAEAPGRLWMQLYVMEDRKVTEHIVGRAHAAGYEALVFTTDANIAGSREWDRRNFRRPGRPTARNVVDTLRHLRWLYGMLVHGVPRLENFAAFLPAADVTALGASTIIPKLFQPSISWEDVRWLRRIWPGSLLVKGVLSAADADRAAQCGCDGIVLTNHGGRQLDYCVSPVEVLPETVERVGERMAVIVDGGFRRGTDVIKALALGARSVMVGRATLYGLIAAGEQGARRALEILTGEIDRTLGLLGCCSIGELGPHLLRGLRAEEHAQGEQLAPLPPSRNTT